MNRWLLGTALVADLLVGSLFMGHPLTTGRVTAYIVCGVIAVALLVLLIRRSRAAQ